MMFECFQLRGDEHRVNEIGTEALSLEKRDVLRILPAETSSEVSINFIQQWLSACFSTHAECPGPLTQYPEGLLQGIRFLQIDNHSVVLTEDMRPLRYAALSHCWGSGMNILKTTTQTLKDHKTGGIALETLPKTFQDAVTICQRLEISFLWIDSLCIIQDSSEDWRNQASRMAEVYENAVITIAASKAQDPSQGCFTRTHWSYRGVLLPGYADTFIRRVCVPPGAAFHSYHNHDEWPLYKRGWIYQELVLSPRVIHFNEELMWYCTTHAKRGQSMTNKFHGMFSQSQKHKRFTAKDFRRQWYQTIEAYSWRDMTFPTDKLPAIAAIAERQQQLRPNDQYLAGLWKSTLLFDLLWYIKDKHATIDLRSQITDGNVPSWSWASTKLGVTWTQFSFQNKLRCVEVIEAIYTTDGPIFSGNITMAEIVLRVPKIKLEDLRAYDDLELDLSSPTGDEDELSHPDSRLMELTLGDLRFDTVVFTSPTVETQQHSFAIPLSDHEYHGDEFNLRETGSLMLLVTQTHERGHYRRLGVAYVAYAGTFYLVAKQRTNGMEIGKDDPRDLVAQAEYRRLLVEKIENLETHIITLI
ncbi:HET-domain-containing protein [Plenodomus tracheiphilus IPT5]|uniref:HET-domain-containing protein n=1 Tax=Plenodomus tracheiphilus IPT5 TaxID=1408161 RepID=A0A6A7ARZ0_9PLEO|nr:HET-domain-containing protein [Plenodomus tracheiphilus IPT5]